MTTRTLKKLTGSIALAAALALLPACGGGQVDNPPVDDDVNTPPVTDPVEDDTPEVDGPVVAGIGPFVWGQSYETAITEGGYGPVTIAVMGASVYDVPGYGAYYFFDEEGKLQKFAYQLKVLVGDADVAEMMAPIGTGLAADLGQGTEEDGATVWNLATKDGQAVTMRLAVYQDDRADAVSPSTVGLLSVSCYDQGEAAADAQVCPQLGLVDFGATYQDLLDACGDSVYYQFVSCGEEDYGVAMDISVNVVGGQVQAGGYSFNPSLECTLEDDVWAPVTWAENAQAFKTICEGMTADYGPSANLEGDGSTAGIDDVIAAGEGSCTAMWTGVYTPDGKQTSMTLTLQPNGSLGLDFFPAR